jgi:hypothetical protein
MIGFPNFASYQRGLRLREANNQLAQTLQNIAARATNENRALNVVFLPGDATGADVNVTDTAGNLVSSIILEGNTLIDTVTGATSNTVTFNVRGQLKGINDTVVLTTQLGDSSGTVRLLTTGKTVVQ